MDHHSKSSMNPSPSQSHHQVAQTTNNWEWSFEENKIFENALAELVDPSSPSFFQDIAYRIPWKSVEEIKEHYGSLVQDLNSIIHSDDRYPQPIYEDDEDDHVEEGKEDLELMEKSRSCSSRGNQSSSKNNPRRISKSLLWTKQEHQLFLLGLDQFGKGDWRNISRHCVVTKTPTQVASHGQKYFKRLNNPTPASRRRYSIHDDPTVDPNLIPDHRNNLSNIVQTQTRVYNIIPDDDHDGLPPVVLPPNPNPNDNIGEGFDLAAADRDGNNAQSQSNATMTSTKDCSSSSQSREYPIMEEPPFVDDPWSYFVQSDSDLP